MRRLWRMFRFVRYIHTWEKYLEAIADKNPLEISKPRMEATVITLSFALKYGYRDWQALDTLNACEAERLSL